MKRFTVWAIASTTATLFTPFFALTAQADNIVPASDGTGTQVAPTGNQYDITGGTTSGDNANLFHSFSEFNLLTGETANFVTDPAILNILSRITGGDPSLINGLLQVSGSSANLFLINPNGILFGPDSALNLQGSFTAITADQVNFATGALGTVGTPDYAALVGDPQSFSFSLETPGSVVNAGSLSVAPGESVVLVGGQVLNLGTIAAPGGEVVISAVEGGNLVRIAQEGLLLNLEVETLGDEAMGTALPFSPLALPELLTGSAIAQATNVTVNPDGTVQLASGTPVNTTPGATTVSGRVNVTDTQGGQILILGSEIALTDAQLEAAGTLSGGQVRIGGDYQGGETLPRAQTTTIDRASIIDADALETGDGGIVIVWADGDTQFQGLITARGGAQGGNGGLVETSGRESIAIAGGQVDASADQGNAGLWFVDPTNINIDADLAVTIESTLAGGTNFTASTIDGDPNNIGGPSPGEGDILLASNIDATATNNATLTLTASRYIKRSPFAEGFETINITAGNLVLNLNQEGLADPTNPTISDAVDIIGSVTGETTLNLGAGTYQEPSTIALDSSLTLNGAGAENTILDGSNVSFGAIEVLEGQTVILSNLTIANATHFGDGGAISNEGDLTIANSIIRNNIAINSEVGGNGGGIANSGTLRLIDSQVVENIAEGVVFSVAPFGALGGGIYNEGTLEVTRSNISNNTTQVTTGEQVGEGGGIFNAGGTVTINNSTLSNNRAGANGGAISSALGTITVSNQSNLVNNTAIAGSGGGISSFQDSLAIDNSTLSNNEAATEGGGISAFSSIVNISNGTEISDNTAIGSGGGIDSLDSTLTVENSTITGNLAGDFGGGINNLNSTLTVIDSTISNNESQLDSGGGGGIENNGDGTISGSLISGNTAAGFGGGIRNFGFLTISNSTISGNTANLGGGIDSDGNLFIFDSTLSGNQGTLNGGAIANGTDNSSIFISGSTISDNIAVGRGGGIEFVGGTLDIFNSTISGNQADTGGGISNTGNLNIANSTLTNNAADLGGGIANGITNDGGSAVTLTSSLVSGNGAASGANLTNRGDGIFTSGGNNLIGSSGNAGIEGVVLDASDIVPLAEVSQILETTLADNGGPTQTHALLPGSPAINRGSSSDSSSDGGSLATDQRGISVVDGVRDIGAFESQGFTIALIEGSFQTTSTNQSFVTPLTVRVSSDFDEPVAGGTVTFLPPGAGPSAVLNPNPAIIGSDGIVSVDATANEVAGVYDVVAAIASTDNTVTFRLGNTASDGEIPPPPPPPLPETDCPTNDCTTLVNDAPDQEDRPSTIERRNREEGNEAAYVNSFEDYLNVEAAAFEDFDALERAEVITGTPPALVYARFVSNTEGLEVAQTSASTKESATGDALALSIIAQAERRTTPAADEANQEDVLELVLVTANNEPRRFSTGATRSEVLSAVRQLHIELTDRTRRRLDNYLIPAQALYGWLMAPLEDTLDAEGIGHVSFILDEGLRSLPLAALHDGEQFVIESYSVGLMPSLSLTDTRIGNIRNASVLAMGASEFSDQPPLPAVPIELSAIESLWSGEQYLNEAFTPERVVQERREDAYPVLHLATHGQFSNGALSNSYIQFWDRRLGLDQLPQLQLSQPAVELLVLSACRTVLGGEEAELGFAGLAVKSGAKSAIAALWQVSDLETAGFMAELYTQLGQASYKAEALRQAQLAMLRGEVTLEGGNLVWSGGQIPLPEDLDSLRFAETRHPFYWSAFTLVGSPW
jgi:filamentous hemagglutinin family protein